MDVRVLEMPMLPNYKATRAFCDVEISGITIRDFRVYQTNGKSSVRNPFTSYKDSVGNLKFRQIVDLRSNIQAEINIIILGGYFRRLKENQHDQQSQ